MTDKRYEVPVAGVDVLDLPARMKQAIKAVEGVMPPKTGVIVFTFDFGAGGGLAYIANADREDCVAALREWIQQQEVRRA